MSTNVCFVCGQALVADDPNCSKCRTPVEDLSAMSTMMEKPRFLFSGLQEPQDTKSTDETTPAPLAQNPARKPPTRRQKQAPTNESAKQPVVFVQEPAEQPLVRTPLIPQEEEPRPDLSNLLTGWALDMLFCGLLNALVFALVLKVSVRDVSSLITYSLLPVTLSLISFTILYFALFYGIFHKTLGALILESRKVPEQPVA